MKICLAVLLLLAPLSALALINPKYTVVDLMRDCGQVYVLRLSEAKDGKLTGDLVETLAGEPPARKTFAFDYADANDLPEEKLAGTAGALAVMCVQKKKQDSALVGALEFGTTWIGLTQNGDKWKLDKDPNDLETVWGGSAKRLVAAIRYTLSDPGANFPVVANMTWGKSQSLGKLAGPARGCVVTSAGVVVLAQGGNKVFAAGKDVTPQAGNVELPAAVPADLLPPAAKDATAVLPGDFDADGQLDCMVAGKEGVTLWTRGEKGQWENSTLETGELGVAANNPVIALSACDLNGDGRQGVACFYAAGSPQLFFNRGFACFGLARTLTFDEKELPAGDGQQAGVVTDLNGDSLPDLFVVDRHGEVWAIYGESKEPRRFQITVESAKPVVLTALLGQRVIGMWALRAGEPVTFGLPQAGKVTLRWGESTRDVAVVGRSRVKL